MTPLAPFFLLFSAVCIASDETPELAGNPEGAQREAVFLSRGRQMTFEGRRSGEGYFDASGRNMVFQSERYDGNPFFQIFLMNRDTGKTELVSPGKGRTTCAWIHPEGDRVLFASTHDDPLAEEAQKLTLQERNSGREPRYSWNYDRTYETVSYTHLTLPTKA